jgi:hypothetical protein
MAKCKNVETGVVYELLVPERKGRARGLGGARRVNLRPGLYYASDEEGNVAFIGDQFPNSEWVEDKPQPPTPQPPPAPVEDKVEKVVEEKKETTTAKPKTKKTTTKPKTKAKKK